MDEEKNLTAETEEKEMTPEEKAKNRLHEFLMTILELVIVAAAVFLFLRFVAFRSVVEGTSMVPELEDKNNLVVERVSYYFRDPGRFEIIVFKNTTDKNDPQRHLIKRVIGLPGETVEIKDGYVCINDEKLTSDVYGAEVMKTFTGAPVNYGPVEVPEDSVFVLGDNRNNSKDSRSSEVGCVSKKQIMGRVLFRIWPFSEMKHYKRSPAS